MGPLLRALPRIGVVAMVVVLAACSGVPAATPEPTPTPTPVVTPSPTPEPTPVDAAPAFMAALRDPDFSARATLTGELSLLGVTLPLTGDAKVSGGDNYLFMTLGSGDAAQVTEQLTVNGTSYERAFGHWFERSRGAQSSGMTDTVFAQRFTDTGLETRDGVRVHHLELSGGEADLPLSAFGMTDPSITNGRGTVEAFALDDGTPVAIAIDLAWQQAVDRRLVDATMTFEMAFADVGRPQLVDAPEDLWAWYTSDLHGYRVAHPADWDVEPGDAENSDFLTGFDDNYVYAWSGPAEGSLLTDYVSWIRKHVDDWHAGTRGRLISDEATTLAGLRARSMLTSITWEEGPVWIIEVLAVRDDVVYSIGYVVAREPTAADRALFEEIVATYSVE